MSETVVGEQDYGAVFTRRWVAEVILDLVDYTVERDLASVRLVEPSCGSGAFLGPIVERLIQSARIHGHALADLGPAIRAYDLQPEHVTASRELCASLLTEAGLPKAQARLLTARWVTMDDFLLNEDSAPADVVVGNPPYIRYDALSPDLAAAYRSRWDTMRGRGDIYVGFIERSLALLSPGGKLGFICADRWMRNQYGAALRALVSDRYAVEHVWTMHDVDAFEAEVAAYPAIIVLGNHQQGPVVVADTTAEFGEASARALVKSTHTYSLHAFAAEGVKAHVLPRWFSGDDLWPTGSPARLALIEKLTDEFEPLHNPERGTRVGIGIATGADKVYVTKNPDLVEHDRLLPLAMRLDLLTGEFQWQGNYLVNPWAEDGSLVSLDDYPKLAAYLEAHPALKKRHTAKKNPRGWYRTIDKVTPGLAEKPKLLLQDMKAFIHPVLEPGGRYPHHNLYYVVSDSWDIEALGGLLLSRIAQAFIEAYCVRMRGGTLRFQAQYLKQIRMPAPESLSKAVQRELRDAFRARDVDAATRAAARAYGINLHEFELEEGNGISGAR